MDGLKKDDHAGAPTVVHADASMTIAVDGNKSLYLVFVGVVFSQHLRLLLEQLGQQHLGCFVRTAGQQHLDCFRTAVSI
jgi:hypothetical protein